MGSRIWRTHFAIPIVYPDPNASDFDESHRQGTDTVNIPRSHIHYSSGGQNSETYPIFVQSVVHLSNPKSYGQSQDFETATDLRYIESSKQTSESDMDAVTAYEPIQHPSSRQCDALERLKLTILQLKIFRN